jgi:hypothetical protein
LELLLLLPPPPLLDDDKIPHPIGCLIVRVNVHAASYYFEEASMIKPSYED